MKSGNKYIIATVGKTHSGKSTFGKKLKQALKNSVWIDNESIDLFLKEQFNSLYTNSDIRATKTAENPDLKMKINQVILKEALENNLNVILTNANMKKITRKLEEAHAIQNDAKFILVFLNYPNEVLKDRISKANKSTKVLNESSDFYDLLDRQNKLFEQPTDDEADYFLEVNKEEEVDDVIKKILQVVSS
jgi:shikimate kinase